MIFHKDFHRKTSIVFYLWLLVDELNAHAHIKFYSAPQVICKQLISIQQWITLSVLQNSTTFRYSSLVYSLCANLCFLIQTVSIAYYLLIKLIEIYHYSSLVSLVSSSDDLKMYKHIFLLREMLLIIKLTRFLEGLCLGKNRNHHKFEESEIKD